MLFQESVPQRVQVNTADAMRAIGVLHKAELLVQVDEFIDETLRALEMHVVVARAVDDQQFS